MFLRMFFDSIKEVNRLRKEINMLLSKGIKILTLKLLLRKTWKNWHSRTSIFYVQEIYQFWGAPISLNFQTRRLEWMKYFRVSLVTVESLIFMFGNQDKDKHKLSETKRWRWNWDNQKQSSIGVL